MRSDVLSEPAGWAGKSHGRTQGIKASNNVAEGRWISSHNQEGEECCWEGPEQGPGAACVFSLHLSSALFRLFFLALFSQAGWFYKMEPWLVSVSGFTTSQLLNM